MDETLVMAFVGALGACIGSFLNVVIHRLPRGQSLAGPGSHCPWCGTAIKPYDNIPIVSWLMLGGRCRSCRAPISGRYAVVETATALAFLAAYDAFFKSSEFAGFLRLGEAGPIFAGHLVMLAVLIACSALDIEYYLIDLRPVYVVMGVGGVAWAATGGSVQWVGWGLDRLPEGAALPRMAPVLLAGVLGAGLGEAIRRIYVARQGEDDEAPADGTGALEEHMETGGPSEAPARPRWETLLMALFVLAGVAVAVWFVVGSSAQSAYAHRSAAYIGWLFLAILAGSMPKRTSDALIVEAIETERMTARVQALWETASLLPAAIGGLLSVFLLLQVPSYDGLVRGLLELEVVGLRPVAGLTAAGAGLLTAAAFGWLIRIGFTLVFGKEAMGVGDIYILAAVGAVGGPILSTVGFFVGSVAGVLGVLVLLLWKTNRALSYVPWIAIGVAVAVQFYEAICRVLGPIGWYVRTLVLGE